jgi:hypothetical protein
MTSILWTLMLVATGALAQTQRHPDYTAGHTAWVQQKWPLAGEHLSKYWDTQPYSQTYDVAYWLGTSWCRQPTKERPGVDLLDWSYHFQSMPEKERLKFREQRDLCIGWLTSTNVPRAVPTMIVASMWSNATMRAEGKTYYLANGARGGLTSYPVRVKRPLPEGTFEGRLIELGQTDAIKRVVRQQAPEATLHVGRYSAIASLSSHSEAQLRTISDQLDDFVGFMNRAYELPAPRHYMTIYLFRDIPALRTWADRLHGFEASPLTLGYSLQNDLSILAMQSSTQTGTLLHEITHLLIRGAYGEAPQWLDEGIASLYETSTLAGDRYYGEPNWRSKVFSGMRGIFRHLTLTQVITSPWFSDEPSLAARSGEITNPDEQAYLLAYSRIFALYLQEHDLLRPMFKAFRNRKPPEQYVPAPQQAIRLVEATAGKSLGEIDASLDAWLPQVDDPEKRLHNGTRIEKEVPAEGGR